MRSIHVLLYSLLLATSTLSQDEDTNISQNLPNSVEEAAAPSAESLDGEIVSGPEQLPPSATGPLDDCDPEMVGFELVTGYVFSAPGNVLDSIPGTLMLTDCLETCQGNDSCQSVNYETGLCVLFSSHADSLPGKCSILIFKDRI